MVYDDGGRTLLQGGWQPIPHLLTKERIAALKAKNDPVLGLITHNIGVENGDNYENISEYFTNTQSYYRRDIASQTERDHYPWLKIDPLFKDANIAFVNLETPLSDTAYRVGYFKNSNHVVESLKYGGINVVAVANNHMLDAERQVMFDTLKTLDQAGISHAGAGAEPCFRSQARSFPAERYQDRNSCLYPN